MAVLDRDLRYLFCNRKLAEINGRPPEDHIGRTVAEMVPGVAPAVEDSFRAVLDGSQDGLEFRVTGTTAGDPGHLHTWVENVRPLAGPGGSTEALLITVHDVTDLEDARAALAESERKLRASHQLSRDGFTILRAERDTDGHVKDFVWEFANPAAEAMLDIGDLMGRRLLDVLPGSKTHPDLFPRFARLLDAQGADEVELLYRSDGIDGWYRNAAFAIDSDRIAVGFRNITQRRQTQEQLRLVTQELKHRNRNLLTVVAGLLSLAGKTAPDVPQLVENVQKQLQALAASQDLLTATIMADVPLDATVAAALEPYKDLRIEVLGGPDVRLPQRAVVPLIMALSEMATNAVKYGALSAAGAVSIAWARTGERVELSWQERGGPPVEPPSWTGLGSQLLEVAGQTLPGGTVERTFAREGLTVCFRFTPEPAPPKP